MNLIAQRVERVGVEGAVTVLAPPQQIAGRLRLLDPLRASLGLSPAYASHETIYRAIYGLPRGTTRSELVMQLRQSRAGRRRRSRGKQRFAGLLDITPISARPP